MKSGKKILVFTFFVLVVVLFSFVSIAQSENNYQFEYEPDCFPKYECGDWSNCIDGLNIRTCQDKKCGRREIIERKICDVDTGCQPQVKCSEWSQCDYSEKVEDLLHGKITFGGYRHRACIDEAGCADSFEDNGPCEEEYSLKLEKKTLCNKEYLSAIDSLSGREVARIDLESWKVNKLNIILTEGNSEYCSSCYNGLQDKDEKGIDCGGNCMPCKEKSALSMTKIVQGSLWALAFVFFIVVIHEIFQKKRSKIKNEKRG